MSTQNDHGSETMSVYAWLSTDVNGVEGIIALPVNNAPLPLVLTDRKRAEDLAGLVVAAAQARNASARLVRFARAEDDLMVIDRPE